MGGGSILEILETILFWLLVFYIAWNESATPQWAYLILFGFLIYFAIRAILKKQGMERFVWIYTVNMIVILYLMNTFMRK